MRKAVYGVLAVFACVSAILVLTETAPPSEVEVLAIRENRAFLVTSAEETLELTLFLSHGETFLTERANIVGARIVGDDVSLAMTVAAVVPGETTMYRGNEYLVYHFLLDWQEVYLTSGRLDVHEAKFELDYRNGVEMSLAIGDLSLVFAPVAPATHIDFFRLYGETVHLDGRERLVALVIGLEPRVLGSLTITMIELCLRGVSLDLAGGVLLDPDGAERMPPASSPSGGIMLGESGLYRFPLIDGSSGIAFSRFPLLIHYRYLGVDLVYAIDDFQYFRKPFFAEVDDADISRYRHHYS